MTFTTLTFLLFLAVVFLLYWRLKTHRQQNILLLIAGYFFYGWWDYRFCSLMLASSLVDFTLGRWLARSESLRRRQLVVLTSCLFNLGLLGFFKYLNFFASSLSAVFRTFGWQLDIATVHVILPIGISFYTFQSISYIIDVYRREIEATRSLLDYMTYVSFFPQMLAGPIERGKNLLPQILSARHFDEVLAVDGLRLILWGFFKKMVIADNLATCADQAFAHPGKYDGLHLLLGTVCFAFQIYGDFSAYSDIAIGTARLFGIKLMRNFAYPYFSPNVAEFWRRWHISLSTWFRDYLYVPLGGSRVGRTRRIFNIMTTFAVSGLWHGAAWTYLAWGTLNGAGTIPSALATKPPLKSGMVPGGEGALPHPRVALRILGTFFFICLTWIFFRARSFGDAYEVIRRIATWPFVHQVSEGFTPSLSTRGLMLLLVTFIGIEWAARKHLHPLAWARSPRVVRWALYTLVIWTTLYLRPLRSGNFIYFQF